MYSSSYLTSTLSHLFLSFVTVFFCLFLLGESFEDTDIRAAKKRPKVYRAEWVGTGQWVGRAWWANPLWDWRRIGNGRVRAPAAKMRSLSLLPLEITSKGESFTIKTTITFFKTSWRMPFFAGNIVAGFAIGRTGPLNDYRSAAVYPESQLDTVFTGKGIVSIGGRKSSKPLRSKGGPVTLTLKGKRVKNSVWLSLTARQFKSEVSVSSFVPLNRVIGPFALITGGPEKSAVTTAVAEVTFEKFSVSGTMLKRYGGRMYGAIMWSQYTISANTLRLQAQLAPIDKPVGVQLTVRTSNGGKTILTRSSRSDRLSRTAQFTVKNWDTKQAWRYEVQLNLMGRLHKWSGTIQREPSVATPFKIAVFSCDEGYMFPQNSMVTQVSRQKPNLLYFAGDQMYNPTGGFLPVQIARTNLAMLDYLLRWYLFGWTWRNLLRDRPSVIIPDDHDVFQGNLWGDGGRAFPRSKMRDWSYGGYLMPGPWVSAVERCHTGHLPPPRANFRTKLGLKPYFTSLSYSGLSMAVLEDRKFKSAPRSFSSRQMRRGDGGNLLGYRQEQFLKKWVKEWKGASMKIAFSQTIFCDAATHTGLKLDRSYGDTDTGGWPFDARNRAVKLMGQGNVLALHGDQHLGTDPPKY